ncbi:unnamed protein product [Polarella glacialis]|uniref:Uncharacterized protein n=1 Tax=Polarella glacialis TaxID=89957 RepID=A0A813F1L4_POLGL|nr:unnamed protein product [Polarella glacialis]
MTLLELVLALNEAGWVDNLVEKRGRRPLALTQTSERIWYSRASSGNYCAPYLRCMLGCDAFFTAGLTAIHHLEKVGYYVCLLELLELQLTVPFPQVMPNQPLVYYKLLIDRVSKGLPIPAAGSVARAPATQPSGLQPDLGIIGMMNASSTAGDGAADPSAVPSASVDGECSDSDLMSARFEIHANQRGDSGSECSLGSSNSSSSSSSSGSSSHATEAEPPPPQPEAEAPPPQPPPAIVPGLEPHARAFGNQRDMRSHALSFCHGPFHVVFRDDKDSYTAHCFLHAGRCARTTQVNQGGIDVVRRKLRWWLNEGSSRPDIIGKHNKTKHTSLVYPDIQSLPSELELIADCITLEAPALRPDL